VQEPAFWHNLLLVIAGFTMVIGGMSASIYYDSRRILSYHIISQIGYMVMGLGIFTPLAIAGAIFFTIHNMLAKTNVFLVAGIIRKLRGSFDLKKVGGLFNSNPAVAVVFIIPGLALAGVPPISGFFAKFILIKAGFEAEQYLISGIAILTGMLTLYSMIKIWNEAFLKAQPKEYEKEAKTHVTFAEIFPSALLALASLLLGIFASPVFNYIMKAAEQLSDPVNYITSVLNI
jgi:multicomponent Na+:H+ antiporter subunit D